MDFVFIKSSKKGYEEYGSVRARVRHEGKIYKISLRIMIKESEWKKYRSLQYTPNMMMRSMGISYCDFASMMMQIKHQFEGSFDPQTAKSIVHQIVYATISHTAVMLSMHQNENYLVDYLAQYVIDLETGARTKQRHSKLVSEGYLKILRALLSTLKRYEEQTQERIRLDDVTMQFQRKFIKFMRDNGFKPNTINTRMGSIRTVMQVAYQENKTQCTDFQNPQFVPCKEEVDEIILRPEQIDAMQNLDLSTKEAVEGHLKKHQVKRKTGQPYTEVSNTLLRYLNYSRDVFIVGCLTGQRYSDYRRINSKMIVVLNGQEFIRLVQQKTQKVVFIPLDNRVKAILDKYEGRLPYIKLHTIIHHLRLLGEMLGWQQLAVFDSSSETNKPSLRFCDMISTHTARRSFATNAYAAGVGLASIIAVTGHSSERTCRSYLKLDARDKALMAAENFKGFLETGLSSLQLSEPLSDSRSPSSALPASPSGSRS